MIICYNLWSSASTTPSSCHPPAPTTGWYCRLCRSRCRAAPPSCTQAFLAAPETCKRSDLLGRIPSRRVTPAGLDRRSGSSIWPAILYSVVPRVFRRIRWRSGSFLRLLDCDLGIYRANSILRLVFVVVFVLVLRVFGRMSCLLCSMVTSNHQPYSCLRYQQFWLRFQNCDFLQTFGFSFLWNEQLNPPSTPP